ncbi:MAG: hypothetical protein H0V17_00140 [Deltaproteobacteria bacterium]|nr:hypothetical protein [Deltaproteobacteria bacterium]
MLRVAISVVLLSACGSSARAPAWPKAAEADTDGGESLAPHKASPLATSDSSSDASDVVVDTSAEKPAVKATDDKDKPAETPKPTTPTITAPEEVINVDDLVIEIDD